MKLSVPVDDGVTLNVRHRPGGDGRPFLLLHGLGSNARMWDEVADRLAAAGHPVYAVDMRGHGESELPPRGYDNATAVTDLVAVCRGLRLTGALLAGHSWGGNLAVRFAAVRPDLTAGLALVDGGWISPADVLDGGSAGRDGTSPDGPGADKPKDLGWWSPDARTTVKTMRELLRAIHPTWSATAVEASLADMVEGPDGLLGPRLPLEHYVSIGRSMRDDPPSRWYSGVTAPVLLLNAVPPNPSPSWVTWVRKWVADAEAALPRTESRWYDDSDHSLHAEHPDRVAADLLDLARTVGRPTTERA